MVLKAVVSILLAARRSLLLFGLLLVVARTLAEPASAFLPPAKQAVAASSNGLVLGSSSVVIIDGGHQSYPPFIITQPVSRVMGQGMFASLNVGASGGYEGNNPLIYQWHKNGVDIGGGPSIMIGAAVQEDAGDYSVTVSNTLGTVTSGTATLTLTGPAFAPRPIQSGTVVTPGASVSFNITATGSGTLSYQWTHDGQAIPGATNPELTLVNVQYADGGAYQVRVTDATGTGISLAAPLEVLVAPGSVVAWGDNSEGQCTVPSGLSEVVAIGAGYNNSLAIQGTGTAITWGGYSYDRGAAFTGITGVVAIAAGQSHALALLCGGTVLARGNNNGGECNVPSGLSGVVAVAAAGEHSLALKENGTVVAWGFNGNGQSSVPAGLSGVVAIAAGGYHSLALKSDGTVVAWGFNGYGEGVVPVGLNGVVAIAAGTYHNLALKSDGSVVAWGDNRSGQSTVPAGLSGVVAIAAGGFHNLALQQVLPSIVEQPFSQAVGQGMSVGFRVKARGRGLSYQWRKDGVNIAGGTNAYLEINYATAADIGNYSVEVTNADGHVSSETVTLTLTGPVFPVQPVQSGTAVASGSSVTFSVTATGSGPLSYQWLHNGVPIAGATNAVLGLANLQYLDRGTYQVRVSDATRTALSRGGFLNVLLSPATVVAWGANGSGQCTVPAGLSGVVAISGGGSQSLALQSDGTVVGWGENDFGQCTVPTGLSGVVAIAGGGRHSLALKDDGTVAGWGYNYSGQCIAPAGLNGVVAIAAGQNHSLALKSDGAVVAWGDNWFGKAAVPAGLGGSVAIAAGDNHSLALKSDGSVVGWGYNYSGQITAPAGLSGVVAIAAGANHSLALKSDGTVVAWGYNGDGQTTVPAGLNGVVAIAGGGNYSLALKSDGTLVRWGETPGQNTVPPGLATVFAIAGGSGHSLLLQQLLQPTIVTQPVSSVGGQEFAVTFSVMANGGALSYQWQKDGVPLADGTAASLSISYPTAGDVGNYSVEVSNLVGAVTSETVNLTLNGPSFPSQPVQSGSVIQSGSSVTFSVAATGSGYLSYQWLHNGIPIPGATEGVLTLENVQYGDQGAYLVRITDGTGTGISRTAFLNVLTPPASVVAWGENYSGQCKVPDNLNGVVAIDAGQYHCLVLKSDGLVAAWGNNNSGQSLVPAGLNEVVAIAAAGSHSLALKRGGTVVAWGDNAAGQSVVPSGLKGVMAIAAGETHSLALRSDGTVVAWGGNNYGQSTVPAGLSGVLGIAAGLGQSLALKSDGTVVVWGWNYLGQDPMPIGLNGVVAVAGGWYLDLALKSDGTVVAWANASQIPVPAGLNGVVAIDGAQDHSLALKNDGTVVGWGDNWYGQSMMPAGLGKVIAIAGGGRFSMVLQQVLPPRITVEPLNQVGGQGMSATFNVTATGWGLKYQWRKDGISIGGATSSSLAVNYATVADLGAYDVTVSNEAGSVTSDPATLVLSGPIFPAQPLQSGSMVSSGTSVTFAVSATGTGEVSYQWLHNGQPIPGATNAELSLANVQYPDRGAYQVRVTDTTGTGISRAGFLNVLIFPSAVAAWGRNYSGESTVPADLNDVVAITGGYYFNLALRSNGTVVSWGNNYYGQTTIPAGLSGVAAIAGGGFHSLALKSDGTVVAWGDNPNSQCTVPAGLSGVVAIAGGCYHSLALKSDGRVVAWGDNTYGRSTVPAGLSGVVAIAAGGAHSLALRNDGTVVAWGGNDSGQTTIPAGLSGVVAIAAGNSHSLALTNSGTVVAWGDNSSGQSTVPAGLSEVTAIAASGAHNLALTGSGTVAAWGNNDLGQSILPVGLSGVVAIAAGNYHSLALRKVTQWVSQPETKAVNLGAPFSLRAESLAPGPFTYQWMHNNQAIAGATASIYTVPEASAGDIGIYQCLLSSPLGCLSSATTTVSINPLPAITAEALVQASFRAVLLEASIDPNGEATTAYLEYGLTDSYGKKSSLLESGSGSAFAPVRVTLTGLSKTTSYHYRWVAVNKSGTKRGDDQTFSTTDQMPGLALSGSLEATYQSCVVSATLIPNGLPTQIWFEYGPALNDYRQSTTKQKIKAGAIFAPFDCVVSGLDPATTYHGRTVAVSSSGTIQGADQVWTTLTAQITPVVLGGDSAAGFDEPTAKFAHFGSPILNDAGQSAFLATAAGAGLNARNNTGLWVGTNLIARTSKPALYSGTAIGVYETLGSPVLNAQGKLAFAATLKGGASGVWTDLSGAPAPAIREGDTIPVGSGNGKVSAITQFVLTNDSQLLFTAKISGKSDSGLWAVDAGGKVKQLVSEESEWDLADGHVTLASFSLFDAPKLVGGQTRHFNHSGDVLLFGTWQSQNKGLFILENRGATGSVIALNGEAAPQFSGGSFDLFGNPTLGSTGLVAFKAIVSGSGVPMNAAGIWLDSGSDRRLVARTGGSAPMEAGVEGGLFATLGDPVCNGAGQLAFQATLTGTKSAGIWSADPDTRALALVARTGMQAPDSLPGTLFTEFRRLVLPDQGGVVIFAEVGGKPATNGNKQGIWAMRTAGQLHLVVRTGDKKMINGVEKTISSLEIFDPIPASTGQTRHFNANGDLIYKVTFKDRTEAIYRAKFPANKATN